MSLWSVQLFAIRSWDSFCPQASCSWPKTVAEVLPEQIHGGHMVFPLSFSISCLAVQPCFASLQKSRSATGDPAAREQVYRTCRRWQHKQEKGTDAFESSFLKDK